MITGFPNFEAIDASRAKAVASAEWMTKYMEAGKFAMAGTVMARLMVKVA
jgi:hypothetical protein